MALQNNLFALACCALFLLPVAAQARDLSPATHASSPVLLARGPSGGSWHHHPAPPPPPSRPEGRYELRTVERQVPGRYERVWVGERCEPSHRYVRRCEPGHYERSWVPGYTESRQEWVWVDYAPRPRYGRG